MTPYKLCPTEPTPEMVEAGNPVYLGTGPNGVVGEIWSAMLSAAPPMDYISGEEIRKLVAKWREKATHCDEMSLQTTNDSHALALRSKSIHLQLCSDELEKLLKGEGQ